MPPELRIFVSSVQKELQPERRAIKDFILGDPLMRRFCGEVFLFEDLPAQDRQPDDVYLTEVERCDLYVGILGTEYGWKNAAGLSPTELEFDRATASHRERLIFVKGNDDTDRDPAMAELIRKAGSQLTRRRFPDVPGLIREVYASLVDVLERRGALKTTPFDATACSGAKLKDVDDQKIAAFVETAEAQGRLQIKGTRSTEAILRHFHLLDGGTPTNAAMLLFGRDPARFHHSAQVHCFHFHGTEKRKPIASQQPFEGTLFEVIDKAVEFVMERLARRVGTRARGTQAPVEFEIPRDVVGEAIVNAVAHRDYQSNGFVQVLAFADRIEVWNPGELPPGLTPELLREAHGPIPRNPLIAEPLFRAHYVEKAGTGTTDMIAGARAAGLPEPDFEQRGPHFVATLWRDSLTDERVNELGLNDRQTKALSEVRTRGQLTTLQYQRLIGCSRRTAARDLDELLGKGVLGRQGAGRAACYVLARNRAIIVPIVPTSGSSWPSRKAKRK